MQAFHALRDVFYLYNCKISTVLDLLVYNQDTKGFLYLTNQDNKKIIKSGFFPIPKPVFEELASRAHDRSGNFGEIFLEVLHTIQPSLSGNHYIYPSIEEHSKKLPDSIPNNMEHLAPFYRVIEKKPKKSLEELISQGYSQAGAKIALENIEDPLWVKLQSSQHFGMSTHKLSPDTIYIESDGGLIHAINDLDANYGSFELFLIEQMRYEILVQNQTGLPIKDYPARAREWLIKKHPKIPSDTLQRIINVSKPNFNRKTKWWMKNVRDKKTQVT